MLAGFLVASAATFIRFCFRSLKESGSEQQAQETWFLWRCPISLGVIDGE
jgi:hypothetical protein